jgi:hypothetical protein
LLLFRLLYYILPFAIALVILGLREVRLNVHARRRRNGAASRRAVGPGRS